MTDPVSGRDHPSAGSPRPAGAATKAARHHEIAELVRHQPVHSQVELAELLAAQGILVTQATLSRDLVELDAVKIRHRDGTMIYAIPGEGGDRRPWGAASREVLDARLARICAEVLVSAEASANLVVLRTPPGAAQFLASAIDAALLEAVLGTIAGDDTVLVISSASTAGEQVASLFTELSQRGRSQVHHSEGTDRDEDDR